MVTKSVSVVYCCQDSIASTRRHRCRGSVRCVCSSCTGCESCGVITVLLEASQLALHPLEPAPAAASTAQVVHLSHSNTGRERTRGVQLSLHQRQHHRRHRKCTSLENESRKDSRRSVEPAPAAASTEQVVHVSHWNTGRERTRGIQLRPHQLQHRRHR